MTKREQQACKAFFRRNTEYIQSFRDLFDSDPGLVSSGLFWHDLANCLSVVIIENYNKREATN